MKIRQGCYCFCSEFDMANFPMPGTRVRGSSSGAPLMALFDLLGRRWAMGILWQLCDGGPATFRELRKRCNSVSPTVLNTRLKELREAGLVGRSDTGYTATDLGFELFDMLSPMRDWSHRWATHLKRSR